MPKLSDRKAEGRLLPPAVQCGADGGTSPAVLTAAATRAFGDAPTAAKARDSEAKRPGGPFDDTKHALYDLELRFPVGAKV